MAAVVEVEAHNGVAGLQERAVNGVVGGRAAERLDVDGEIVGGDTVGGKQFCGAATGERFENVGVFDAFVVAGIAVAAVGGQRHVDVENLGFGLAAGLFGRVAFGVDVAERAAHGLAHGRGRGALGRDENDLVVLPVILAVEELLELWIQLREGFTEDEIGHGFLLHRNWGMWKRSEADCNTLAGKNEGCRMRDQGDSKVPQPDFLEAGTLATARS